jgi:cation diffusion facilitator family transporter
MSCSSHSAADSTERDDRKQANRAVAVSAVGLGITGIVELLLALFTGSVALLGDALHNLSDVSTSAVVFIGFAVSKRSPNKSHPYGYERAEDLAGLGVALVIWASAVFAGYESYRKFVSGASTHNVSIGMAGAVLGIIGNQVVARYKKRIGERIQSVTLIADAKHSWLDALSSFGALAGLGLVAAGYPWGDPIAGFAVTLFILHVGYEVTRDILAHLMDSVEPEDLVAAEAAAATVPGVTEVSARARWMGRSLLIEVDGTLGEEVTLRAAEEIGHSVKHAVLERVDSARLVHWTPRCHAGDDDKAA